MATPTTFDNFMLNPLERKKRTASDASARSNPRGRILDFVARATNAHRNSNQKNDGADDDTDNSQSIHDADSRDWSYAHRLILRVDSFIVKRRRVPMLTRNLK